MPIKSSRCILETYTMLLCQMYLNKAEKRKRCPQYAGVFKKGVHKSVFICQKPFGRHVGWDDLAKAPGPDSVKRRHRARSTMPTAALGGRWGGGGSRLS